MVQPNRVRRKSERIMNKYVFSKSNNTLDNPVLLDDDDETEIPIVMIDIEHTGSKTEDNQYIYEITTRKAAVEPMIIEVADVEDKKTGCFNRKHKRKPDDNGLTREVNI